MVFRFLILILAFGVTLTALPLHLVGEEGQAYIEVAEKSHEGEEKELEKEELKILTLGESASLSKLVSSLALADSYNHFFSLFRQEPQTPPPEHV